MHKIYSTLILATCFWILIDCQGGGGGGGGGGGAGGGGGGSSGGGYRGISRKSSCLTEECRQNQQIIKYTIFALCGGGSFIYLLYHCCKGRPYSDNAAFVNSDPNQVPEERARNEIQMQSIMNSDNRNIFRNGMWASRYYQYGKWNGPFEFLLSFDPQTMHMTGWGWDNIGKFTITGHYSNETCRMGITKTYQKDTGDRKQNLGHDVVIQLTENVHSRQFEGKWYVNTRVYSGEDKFELKFVRECDYHEV